MILKPTAVVITVESYGLYEGHDVFLSGHLIGHRPFDGGNSDEAADEALAAFAGVLSERLGWHPLIREPEEMAESR